MHALFGFPETESVGLAVLYGRDGGCRQVFGAALEPSHLPVLGRWQIRLGTSSSAPCSPQAASACITSQYPRRRSIAALILRGGRAVQRDSTSMSGTPSDTRRGHLPQLLGPKSKIGRARKEAGVCSGLG